MEIVYCHHANREIKDLKTQEDVLSEIGEKDAKIMAELFAIPKNISAIYCSPILRCIETAYIINEKINLPIIYDDRLNEYKSIKNESWTDFLQRNIDFLNEISQKHSEHDIVICVTSGVNLSAFICWNFGLKPSNKIPFVTAPSCSPIIFTK